MTTTPTPPTPPTKPGRPDWVGQCRCDLHGSDVCDDPTSTTLQQGFPTPFGGCRYGVGVPLDQAAGVAAALVAERVDGHAHNFAVETDSARGHVVFYGSRLMVDCIEALIGPAHR